MEEEKIAPIVLDWHNPTLGGDCPYCGEWNDYFEQNRGDGDGWYFPPCEGKDEEEVGFGTPHAIIFKCPNCDKEVEVKSIEW